MNIQHLFFELIQVALGVRVCLSHSPTDSEWKVLYDMSKKQSLVGVCFAGVQKLATSTGSTTEQQQEPPEMLYLTWMGMAAKIQQRNETVNKQCVELQKRLMDDGFNSYILKGQGIAQLYPESLRMLRQLGDIDVWIEASIADVVRYARGINPNSHFDYLHVDLDVFDDASHSSGSGYAAGSPQVTEVEAHYRPGCTYNLWKNRKLQKWFIENKQTLTLSLADGEIVVPSVEFNLFYILHHAYRHFINGGIGLRQVMDYYFVLREAQTRGFIPRQTQEPSSKVTELQILLKQFGMMRFTSAFMWVIMTVFVGRDNVDADDNWLICEPNEKEGCFLLNEIIMGGNFGHHDNHKEKHKANESKFGILVHKIKMNVHLLTHYPSEVICAPIYFVWHYFWKKKHKYSLQ